MKFIEINYSIRTGILKEEDCQLLSVNDVSRVRKNKDQCEESEKPFFLSFETKLNMFYRCFETIEERDKYYNNLKELK